MMKDSALGSEGRPGSLASQTKKGKSSEDITRFFQVISGAPRKGDSPSACDADVELPNPLMKHSDVPKALKVGPKKRRKPQDFTDDVKCGIKRSPLNTVPGLVVDDATKKEISNCTSESNSSHDEVVYIDYQEFLKQHLQRPPKPDVASDNPCIGHIPKENSSNSATSLERGSIRSFFKPISKSDDIPAIAKSDTSKPPLYSQTSSENDIYSSDCDKKLPKKTKKTAAKCASASAKMVQRSIATQRQASLTSNTETVGLTDSVITVTDLASQVQLRRSPRKSTLIATSVSMMLAAKAKEAAVRKVDNSLKGMQGHHHKKRKKCKERKRDDSLHKEKKDPQGADLYKSIIIKENKGLACLKLRLTRICAARRRPTKKHKAKVITCRKARELLQKAKTPRKMQEESNVHRKVTHRKSNSAISLPISNDEEPFETNPNGATTNASLHGEKASTNVDAHEAKKAFLMSSIPETLKRSTQSDAQAACSMSQFPIISHVQQKDNSNRLWDMPMPSLRRMSSMECDNKSKNLGNLTLGIVTIGITNSASTFVDTKVDISYRSFKDVLVDIKEQYPTISVLDVMERYQIKKKQAEFKDCCFAEVSKSKGSSDEVVLVNEITGNVKWEQNTFKGSSTELKPKKMQHDNFPHLDNGDSYFMWTDKYRPTSSVDIIGNAAAISDLKLWLTVWKKGAPKVSENQDAGSDSDFSLDGLSDVCNTKLLTGPPGIGKTSVVYALAFELDLEVIEVNASSRRNGKQVLVQLQEATQSHHVAQAPQAPTSRKAGSLVFFEDVDVILKEDEGFLNAVSTFMSTSKRPIILTTNDQSFSSSGKLGGDYEEIQLELPSLNVMVPHLRLLCLCEGVFISHDELVTLVSQVGCCIRQTILTLQYHIVASKRAQLTIADTQNAEMHAEIPLQAGRTGCRKRKRRKNGKADPIKDATLKNQYSFKEMTSTHEDSVLTLMHTLTHQGTGRVKTLVLSIHRMVCDSQMEAITAAVVGECFALGSKMYIKEEQLSQAKGNNSFATDVKPNHEKKLAIPSCTMDAFDKFTTSLSANDVVLQQCSCRSRWRCSCCPEILMPGTSDLPSAVEELDSQVKDSILDAFEIQWTLGWEQCVRALGSMKFPPASLGSAKWDTDSLQRTSEVHDTRWKTFFPSTNAGRILSTDYLPYLRHICRSESTRQSFNKKRGGRFLHYLDSVAFYLKPKIWDPLL